MHEPEKSDSAIVAIRTNAGGVRRGKPTNKTERSVAEPVQPRAGTKGNVSQQSTRRTQDRESVSQALERVRQARRQSPEVGAGVTVTVHLSYPLCSARLCNAKS